MISSIKWCKTPLKPRGTIIRHWHNISITSSSHDTVGSFHYVPHGFALLEMIFKSCHSCNIMQRFKSWGTCQSSVETMFNLKIADTCLFLMFMMMYLLKFVFLLILREIGSGFLCLIYFSLRSRILSLDYSLKITKFFNVCLYWIFKAF